MHRTRVRTKPTVHVMYVHAMNTQRVLIMNIGTVNWFINRQCKPFNQSNRIGQFSPEDMIICTCYTKAGNRQDNCMKQERAGEKPRACILDCVLVNT